MTNQQTVEKHTLVQSILLHWFPGILIGIFYFLIREPLQNNGYPSAFGLILAIVFVLVPVELGYLLLKGKQTTGRYTFDGLISYRKPLPWWQYIVWVLIVLALMGAIFTVMKPLDNFLLEKLFFWMPTLDSGLDGSYSKTALIVTYSIFIVFGVVVGPAVEELYFRGYLLPRIPLKNSELFHSILFAAYHLWTPWMFFTRIVGMIPLIIAVKKKNIYVGIIAHILLNTLDVVVGFVFIFSLA